MDKTLHQKLTKWHEQIVKLKETELKYLELKSQEKSVEGECFLEVQEAKNVDERKAKSFTSDKYKEFQKKFVYARVSFNYEERMLELKIKAYEAEYQTYKIEAEAVRRHP